MLEVIFFRPIDTDYIAKVEQKYFFQIHQLMYKYF